jgi:glycosyltransferase involved in cell wall biosynthesis
LHTLAGSAVGRVRRGLESETGGAVRLTLDCSIALGNRTAVHTIAEELRQLLAPYGARYRHWFLETGTPIDFRASTASSVAGKIIWRLMMPSLGKERLSFLWARPKDRAIIFADPIFAASTAIAQCDTVLVHDLGPITHPDHYDSGAADTYYEAYSNIRRAKPHLVFVSDATRAEFARRFGSDFASVSVIELCCFSELSAVASKPLAWPSRKYFLMVGSLERRKNHLRAIEAFRRSGLAKLGFRLLIAGGPGNCAQEIAQAIDADDSVHRLGFCSQPELRWLYENATALFFPSLLEGFGVPVVEAAHFGALPIVSEDSVLSEVAGPAGITADPHSVESMSDALKAAVGLSIPEYAARIAAVREHQARRFSLAEFRAKWSSHLEKTYGAPASR